MSISTAEAKWLQDLVNEWNDARKNVQRLVLSGQLDHLSLSDLAEAEHALSKAIEEIGR